jgi:catechol 2,3-dioxygenase-like lactoylglutathione lyase family enzyme
MIEITGLDHIVLRTSNMEQMLHFYRDILGCPVERELPPELGLVQLRAGDALIDLVAVDSELGRMGGGPPTASENNMDHFCLRIKVQAEEEISRYLSSHGIDVAPFERRYGAQGYGNSLYLRDPDGNTVELRVRRQLTRERGPA